MKKALTLAAARHNVLEQLREQADAAVARQARVYFKSDEQLVFYGVKTPLVRQVVKALYAQVKADWQLSDAVAFVEALLAEREHEARMAGILLLARFHKQFDAALGATLERWLQTNRCDNWALTDALCMEVADEWIVRNPAELTRLISWAKAENLWLRRAALVTLLPLAKNTATHAEVYAMALRLLHCPEDLMHKAVGWLLREAGQADAAGLRAFLTAHGNRLPRTALRYAIERFTPAERQHWLAVTRQK